MKCPRCESSLEKRITKEVGFTLELDQCVNCEGIWFDKGELHPIEKVIKPVFWETRNIPKEIDQLIGLNCPHCDGLMKKAEHPRDHHVILDYCESCEGIWLDKGEVESIQNENWLITIKNLLLGS